MSNTTNSSQSDNSKTIAIVSYITLIGWIIALVMHNGNKSRLGAYHLRQMLGLMIIVIVAQIIAAIIAAIVPAIGTILSGVVGLCTIVFLVLGVLAAANGQEKPLPIIGEFIQQKLAKVFA